MTACRAAGARLAARPPGESRPGRAEAQKLVGRLDATLSAMTGMLNTLLDINQIETGTVRVDWTISRSMICWIGCTMSSTTRAAEGFVAGRSVRSVDPQ